VILARGEGKVLITGTPAAPGIAIGNAFWVQAEAYCLEEQCVSDSAAERRRLDEAREIARQQLGEIRDRVEKEAGSEEAALFDAHALMLDDPDLLRMVDATVEKESVNVEVAWAGAVEHYARQMEALDDERFRTRAADVRDVGRRVLRALLGLDEGAWLTVDGPAIILAEDLTPSDTARLDKSKVLGFCTIEGGPTSHTAILAKALGLPAVVGVGEILRRVPLGAPLLLDGARGKIVAYPDEATHQAFLARRRRASARAEAERKAAERLAVTVDGHHVQVLANVGRVEQAEAALSFGAEGIGLLRTEFLYADREMAPDEEEQLAIYNRVFDAMGTHPVTVRTLDVGGDKALPYLHSGEEANPFLGWRAIRLCLDRPEVLKTQLRALLRASLGHDMRIMFPMIAVLEELRQAKALLREAREEVTGAGRPVAENVPIGIMVEVPSVVMLADRFAREVDFFSIGTNDLAQYTMAADRTNQRVAHLADACHPAVLRQVKQVIDAAHDQDIPVGLCGELAGDPDAVPILLGLGLDAFSMVPASIPRAKQIVRSWSLSKAQDLASQVLDLDSAPAVRRLAREISP
jgi:phosphoenolpyruvate-protein phosphotransferase